VVYHQYDNKQRSLLSPRRNCHGIRNKFNQKEIKGGVFNHQQPINAPTAGTQAFLFPNGIHIRRTVHNPPHGPSAGWWVLTTANAAGTNDLTCLPRHGGAGDNKFLLTHPMTNVA
jgi:hypothetical protein